MTRIEDSGTRGVGGGNAMPVHLCNDSLPSIAGITGTVAIDEPVTIAGLAYDAAGRLSVAQPTVIFDSMSAYDTSPLGWQALTSGAGNTIAHSAAWRAVDLTLGGTNAGYCVSQTYEYIPYQPWRAQEIVMTGVMGAAVAGVTKRIGAFDATNGVFFEQDSSGNLAVVRRTSTSGSIVNNRTLQSAWNGDTVASLDVTKSQIFVIRFVYLGQAIVEYGLYLSGELVIVHREYLTNVLIGSYMQYATLPLRYEISSNSAASATMRRICTAVNSSGGFSQVPGYRAVAARTTPLASPSEVPLVAIRPALTFNSIVNRVKIVPSKLALLAVGNAIIWRLRYYPPGTADPITGGAWAAVSSISAVESNVSGTAVTTVGSYLLDVEFIGSGAGATSRTAGGEEISLRYPLTLDAANGNNPLTSAVGGNPAYLVLTAEQSGGAASAAGSIEWQEVR